MKGERRYFWVWMALLAGVGLRLLFVLALPRVVGDSLIYGDLATNMLRHHQYGITEQTAIRSTLIRLPGYPLFLAFCFAVFGVAKYKAVLYVQVLVDLLSCCLLADLARRLLGPRAGLRTLWFAAVCPFTANYVAAALTETLAVFCVALSFYALGRWGESLRSGRLRGAWAWPLGAALSFAILLRPDRALLAVAVVSAMLWMALHAKGKVRPLVHVGGVCLLVLLPLGVWAGRNWRVFHVFQPLAPKYATDPGEFVSYGFQRWYRTWAVEFKSTFDVYWTYDGSALAMKDLPPRAFDSPAQRARTQQVIADYNVESAPTAPVDAEFAALAAERVSAHPLRYYVELPVLKLADMWLRPRTEMIPWPLDWWWFKYHPWGSLAATAYALLNCAYLVLAAAGLWRWRRRGWSGSRALGYAMAGYVLLRCVLLLTVDNSEPRYTVDCLPVVILLAAFAFSQRETRASS